MSANDEEFFLENIVKVNRTVEYVLIAAILVPAALCIGNIVNLWEIPYDYCLGMLIYEVTVSVISLLLNRTKKFQVFSMYFGVIAASGFVAFLACKGLVRLSISYAFGTIISCLYYNKPLTISTCIIGYILSIFLSYLQSFTHYTVVNHVFTQVQFIIQMAVGLTIEFAFLLCISLAIANRTQKTMTHLMDSISRLDDTQYKIIQFVAQCLGSHDFFTGRHVIHTQRYIELICYQLLKQGNYTEELTEQNIQLYTTSAFLHDIGKIHIPEGILNKIGKFTDEEFARMKSHTTEGKNLLEFLPKIDSGEFNKIAEEMAYCHHEKWNGTGYPQGLKNTEIPLCARIMAASDVLDALISKRLYKEPMSIESAMKVFEESRGTHFEPCIADAVIACKDQIIEIDKIFKENESLTNNEEFEWWQSYHDNLKSKEN